VQGELTAKQREVLEYLRDCVRTEGRPPTQREAANHFGWSSNVALITHLKALERKGAIRWDRGAARGIQVNDNVDEPEDGIPILAIVPGGPLAEAIVDSDESVPIARSSFARPEELYALRVKGHSMSGAGILDGDVVIIRKTVEARPGQIVVARVDGEVTLKRFTMRGKKVLLRAENPKSRSILVEPWQELVIEGIVASVIRACE